MAALNRIQIIGNLGADPELKYTQSGKGFCSFSVATTEKWTDGSGQAQERTEWHRVTVWTKAAESCSKYLAKGSTVYVEGKLQSREYEKDGVKHRVWDINAMNVIFLSFKEKAAVGGTQLAGPGYEPTAASFPGEDDDIPFGR